MAPLPPKDFAKEAPRSEKKTLQSADEVVARYFSAVGAKQKEVLSSAIVMKGAVESSSGPASVEVVFKQPNKVWIKQTTASQGVSTRATNGTTGWIQNAQGVTQITGDKLKQSAAAIVIYNPVKIPDSVTQRTDIRLAKVDDRDAYILTIRDNSTQLTQLFFDVDSGLLLRRVNVTNTMLGPLNVQWDFSDYRDVNGLKLPFVIRTSDVAAFDTTVRKFSEIKVEPSRDDSIFEPPRTSSP